MIDLTPLDVRNKRGDFKKLMRGYDPTEVDVFLELVAERLEALVRENIQLRDRTTSLAAQVEAQAGREQAVQDALVTAQELRKDMREQSQREADHIMREAESEARRLIAEAEAEVRSRLRGVERQMDQSRDSLQELERRRHRFLQEFRGLLQRELDVVEVEEDRIPLEDRTVDLELGSRRGKGAPAAGAAGAGADRPDDDAGGAEATHADPAGEGEPVFEAGVAFDDDDPAVEAASADDGRADDGQADGGQVPHDGDVGAGEPSRTMDAETVDLDSGSPDIESWGGAASVSSLLPELGDAPAPAVEDATEHAEAVGHEAGGADDGAEDAPRHQATSQRIDATADPLADRDAGTPSSTSAPAVDVADLQPESPEDALVEEAPSMTADDGPSSLELELMAGSRREGTDGSRPDFPEVPDLETVLAEAGIDEVHPPVPEEISPPPANQKPVDDDARRPEDRLALFDRDKKGKKG